jgi:hypothetical protein
VVDPVGLKPTDGCTFIIRIDFLPRLRESIQIGEVQKGVPVGESKVGARVMVGHGFSLF